MERSTIKADDVIRRPRLPGRPGARAMGRTGREGDAEMALRSLRRWPQMQEAIEITGISGATVSEVDGGSRWPTVAPEIRSSVISATWVSVRGHRHGGSTVAPTVAHGGHGGPFAIPPFSRGSGARLDEQSSRARARGQCHPMTAGHTSTADGHPPSYDPSSMFANTLGKSGNTGGFPS